jgi:Cu(I)-responsive transcriptional regulator
MSMQIGAVAKASGVNAKMIRHYESIGLIAAGARRGNNYRDYDARDVHDLRFIRSARELGFSLEEIRALLDLWRDGSRHSSDVRRLAQLHLQAVDNKVAELSAISATLRHLIDACHGDQRPDCPILDGLAKQPGGRA